MPSTGSSAYVVASVGGELAAGSSVTGIADSAIAGSNA